MLNNKNQFFFKFVFPATLAILLFLITLFGIFLPKMKEVIAENKKEMIRELTVAVWSELNYFYHQELNGQLTRPQAQQQAQKQIQSMRYGDATKSYFWISNRDAMMVMHPYRSDLNGQDLSQYSDQRGAKPFVEFASIVEREGEGYVEYYWQWQDAQARIIPKLSFVKGFTPWGWIIGTGIYLDDIENEIRQVTKNLIIVASAIVLLVIGILVLIIRFASKSEKERSWTMMQLLDSKERYRALVESNKEGVVLFQDGTVVFANAAFLERTGYSISEIKGRHLDECIDHVESHHQSLQEGMLKCKEGDRIAIQYEVQRLTDSGHEMFVLTLKNTSYGKVVRTDYVSEYDLLALLNYINLSVMEMVTPVKCCRIDATLQEVAQMMEQSKSDLVVVISNFNEALGMITSSQLVSRIEQEGLEKYYETPVFKIMHSPLPTILSDALWFEAHDRFVKLKSSVLVVVDEHNQPLGTLSPLSLLKFQTHPMNLLATEIANAKTVQELKIKYEHLFSLVASCFTGGTKPKILEQIISYFSDRLFVRSLELACQKIGPPPLKFSLVVFGSQARQEQTLYSDQDHALIFEDSNERTEENAAYFLALGEAMVSIVSDVGIGPCKGLVMASSKEWCRSKGEWSHYLYNLSEGQTSKDLSIISILMDSRCILGDQIIVQSMYKDFLVKSASNARLIFNLTNYLGEIKLPLSFWGIGFVQKEGGGQFIDIKSPLMLLLSALKLYSFKHLVTETNSYKRISELYLRGVISISLRDELIQNFEFLSLLKIRHEILSYQANVEVDHLIDFSTLTELEKTLLKKTLADITFFKERVISELQRGV